jgi:aminoglycoside phosphotransferase (APT) family kinase protein
MTEKQLLVAFKKRLPEKIISVTDHSNGLEHMVKLIQTVERQYIIKQPRQDKRIMIFREHFACQQIKSPLVPTIIYHNKYYLIESVIAGTALNNNLIKTHPKIYIQLGQAIKIIHQIKMSGLGELQSNGQGQHQTAREHINHLLATYSSALLATKIINRQLLQHIKKFLIDNIALFNKQDSRLLHFDLTNDNILIFRNKLSGIIDFGDASCGPIEYDLAKLYIEQPNKAFSLILSGYNDKSVELKKVKYFAVLHLLYMMPWFYKTDPKGFLKLFKLLTIITKYQKS